MSFSWNQFFERYTKNHEEFCFIYKDFKIEFICEGNCYPVVIEYKNGQIKQFEFKTPQDALKTMKFDGKTLKEIWDELD